MALGLTADAHGASVLSRARNSSIASSAPRSRAAACSCSLVTPSSAELVVCCKQKSNPTHEIPSHPKTQRPNHSIKASYKPEGNRLGKGVWVQPSHHTCGDMVAGSFSAAQPLSSVDHGDADAGLLTGLPSVSSRQEKVRSSVSAKERSLATATVAAPSVSLLRSSLKCIGACGAASSHHAWEYLDPLLTSVALSETHLPP